MTREKLANVLETIFGWGIYLCLIAGGLSFFGFLTGILMGGGEGSSSEALAIFLQKQYFPIIIKCASITIGVGLATMYLKNEKALSLVSDKKEAEEELAAIKEQSN